MSNNIDEPFIFTQGQYISCAGNCIRRGCSVDNTIKADKKGKKKGIVVVKRSLQSDRVRYFKSEARKILNRSQNYPKFVAATLIYMLLSVGITAVSRLTGALSVADKPAYLAEYLSFAVYLLLVMPVGAGLYIFALRTVECTGTAPSVAVLLEPFSSAKMLFRVYRCFFAYLWRVFLIILTIGAGTYAASSVYDIYASDGYALTGLLSMLLICVCAVFAAYLLSLYLCGIYPLMAVVLKNGDMSIKEAAKYSKKAMHGHRLELFGLVFSFGFWALFSALTLGIVFAAYAAPYFIISNAVFTSYIYDLAGKAPCAEFKSRKIDCKTKN